MHQRLHFVGAICRAMLAAVAVCCIACGSSTSSPTAPVPPLPAPAPPVTEDRALSVTVKFTGASSCMPHGSFLCALEVAATASDPDGDALTYAWSGCAAGTAATTVCTIKDPGTVAATVTVDDGHGHTVSASASGEGEPEPNRPPRSQSSFQPGPNVRRCLTRPARSTSWHRPPIRTGTGCDTRGLDARAVRATGRSEPSRHRGQPQPW